MERKRLQLEVEPPDYPTLTIHHLYLGEHVICCPRVALVRCLWQRIPRCRPWICSGINSMGI